MKNNKLVNKILIMAFSLVFILAFGACKADTVGLKENGSIATTTIESEVTESTAIETTTIVATEEFNPLAERERTLDEAGVKKEVIDISDIEDGRVYQEIKYAKLSVVNNDRVQKFLDIVNDNLKKNAESFKKDNAEYVRVDAKESSLDNYKYDYDSTDVVVTAINDKYISLRIFTYVNMMGAHPSYYIEGHIFDLNEGKELKINDLVKDKETLRNYLNDWCAKNRESAGLFEEYKSVIDEYVDGTYDLQCYMEKGETYVVFQTYDIAPYAAGAIHVKLPVEILK